MFERFGSIHTHSQVTLNYSLVKSLRKDCIGGHGEMEMGTGRVGTDQHISTGDGGRSLSSMYKALMGWFLHPTCVGHHKREWCLLPKSTKQWELLNVLSSVFGNKLWNNYKKYKEFTYSIPPHSQNFSI